MSDPVYTPPSERQARSVLAIPDFRRLWVALGLSSLGDWLGLLAVTALAKQLAEDNYAQANFAIAGVFIVRLLPAVFIGPFAGVIADRFDRRRVMIAGDVLRGLLFLTIPFFPNYLWLYTATVLIEAISLFWSPAKEASVPNIVPRNKLESANQLQLIVTYGSAPVAAGFFTILALTSSAISSLINIESNPVNLALYLNAATFFFGAFTVARLRSSLKSENEIKAEKASFFGSLTDGWKFIGATPHIRALILGMLGAFAAGGAVVGLARTYVGDLGGGEAAYGVLFGAVFLGLAAGMGLGPRLVRGFSRRRLFGVALTIAGFGLAILAVVANLAIAVFTTIALGFFAGLAWVSGFTMLGLEVADELRGRTFAFVQSLIRVTLVAVLAIAPILAAAIGEHQLKFKNTELNYNGAEITLLLGGLFAAALGVLSYRAMDDRKGIPLFRDLSASIRGEFVSVSHTTPGIFIALEGGEGAGKTTQAKLMRDWLVSQGKEVLLTFEPGDTPVGEKLRHLLLDIGTGNIAPRAEALLYAADRAEHVATVILPALERGCVVITDRYMDSSIAYQGAGRELQAEEVERISKWATAGLYPDLTIVLDIPPKVAFNRFQTDLDRLESEPLDFHERVRQSFLGLAAFSPYRYLVVDASAEPEKVFAEVQTRLSALLAERS